MLKKLLTNNYRLYKSKIITFNAHVHFLPNYTFHLNQLRVISVIKSCPKSNKIPPRTLIKIAPVYSFEEHIDNNYIVFEIFGNY